MTLHSGSVAIPSRQPSGVKPATATAVLICGRLATGNAGLDISRLRDFLTSLDPHIQVSIVEDLCRTPKAIPPAVRGVRRAVFAVCSSDFAEAEARHELQRAGVEPLTAVFLNLGGLASHVPDCDAALRKAKVLLAGAVARARSAPEVGPEHRRPVLPPLGQNVSRRALFTMPPIRYQAVAACLPGECIAEQGCDLCTLACPRGALAIDGGTLRVDKDRCDGCGACASACPTGALDVAGGGPLELDAQVEALLEQASSELPNPKILFLCPEAARAAEAAGSAGLGASPDILPVEVPGAAAVPTRLLLWIVARGAEARIASCPTACRHSQTEAVQQRVDFCRKLLASIGHAPEAVGILNPGTAALDADQTGSRITPREHAKPLGSAADLRNPGIGMEGLAGAILALATGTESNPHATLEHPASPFGLVSLDRSVCTGCGSCAEACPTGAMARDAGDRVTSLSFDARSCTACGQCVAACPEAARGALRTIRATDVGRLAEGRKRVFEDSTIPCRRCGQPVMPAALLGRLNELLGGQGAELAPRIGQYCASCKALV